MRPLLFLLGMALGTIAGILTTVWWAVGHGEPETGLETRDPSNPTPMTEWLDRNPWAYPLDENLEPLPRYRWRATTGGN